MGNQTVGQSTKHYKAKLKKASVTEQALSDDQMEEIREVFDLWDEDASGEIDVRELKPLMSALEEKKMITKAELIKMLSDVDTDGSGTIEFGEFVEMITSKVGNKPYGDVVARLSSRTVVMGNQAVGQSTKHYKAKMTANDRKEFLCNDLTQVAAQFKSQ